MMNNEANASTRHVFDAVPPGTRLGPLELTVSDAANRRYWQSAGVRHPLLDGGALYPPIAANLSILLFQQHCDAAMVQTRQHLRCLRVERAGTPLRITGELIERYEKRGRDYVDIDVQIAPQSSPDDVFWESRVTFTPTAAVQR